LGRGTRDKNLGLGSPFKWGQWGGNFLGTKPVLEKGGGFIEPILGGGKTFFQGGESKKGGFFTKHFVGARGRKSQRL